MSEDDADDAATQEAGADAAPPRGKKKASKKEKAAAEPAAASEAPPAEEAAASAKPVKRARSKAPSVEVGGVALTSPDKVLWPDCGVTKQELAEYHLRVASWSLPRIGHRPLSIVRCPGGVGRGGFYQKHANQLPETVPRVIIPNLGPGPSRRRPGWVTHRTRDLEDPREGYPYLDGPTSLLALVQHNTIEIHPWGAKVDDLERADVLVIDLDPDTDLPWARVVEAAREVKGELEQLGLTAFVKTTGGKGLHVVAPIVPERGWDEVKAFAKAFADGLAARAPERFTSNIRKLRRAGRVYLDFLRNQRDATAIGAYSPRSRAGAPVATPVEWEELADLDPSRFTVRTIPARLEALKRDPWADLDVKRARITDAAVAKVKAAAGEE